MTYDGTKLSTATRSAISCVPEPEHSELWYCSATHHGQVVSIQYKPAPSQQPQSSIGSTPTMSAANMITVQVDIGGYSIQAQVDTGSTWALAMPQAIAEELLKRNLATRAGSSQAMLADGSWRDTGIIMIRQITVEGRALRDVGASVSPSPTAMTLLGMAALSRLGPFTVNNGGSFLARS
jgi:predicted aspartyl protease